MAWYKAGTVTVTQGQTSVTGTGTRFASNARVGDAFRGLDGNWYEVVNIASETTLGILPAYQGTTGTGANYTIAPMQGYVKESADRLRAITDGLESIDADVEAAGAAADAALVSKNAALVSQNAAKTSETNAKTSETNAKASETAANTSKTAAAASQTAAASSQTAAATSATQAGTSATNASNSATAALASQNAAKTSETNSKTSETNSKTSETNSKASETASAASQTAAATSATNAAGSNTAAQTAKTAAETAKTAAETANTAAQSAKTSAATSETNAQKWATNAVDTEVTAGKYSAMHWATKAADIAGSISGLTQDSKLPTIIGENDTFSDTGDNAGLWKATNVTATSANGLMRVTKTNAVGTSASATRPIKMPSGDYILYGRVSAKSASNIAVIWLLSGSKEVSIWLGSAVASSTVSAGSVSICGTTGTNTRNIAQIPGTFSYETTPLDFALQFDNKHKTLTAWLRNASGGWNFGARVACDQFTATEITAIFSSQAAVSSWMDIDYLYITKPNIVVWGDSEAEGKTLYSPAPALNLTNWASHWASYAPIYTGLVNNLPVVKGVGGRTSTQMLANLSEIETLGQQVTFLHASTNDFEGGVTKLVRTTNHQDQINRLVAKGSSIVLLNSMPGTSTYAGNSATDKLVDYNKSWWAVERITMKNVHASVDIAEPVVDAQGYMQSSLTQADGIHPNPSGWALIGARIGKLANETLSIQTTLDGKQSVTPLLTSIAQAVIAVNDILIADSTSTMATLATGTVGRAVLAASSTTTAQTALGLGTAAALNVTTSQLDTTINRLMKTGDFGLGATDYNANWPNTSLDVLTGVPSGLYRTLATTTNLPSGFSSATTVQYYIRNNSSGVVQATQVLQDNINAKTAWRSCSGTSLATPVWGAWQNYVLAGDFGLGALSGTPLLTDFADSAIAPGFYRAFGDSHASATPNAPVSSGNGALSVVVGNGLNSTGYKSFFVIAHSGTTALKAWVGQKIGATAVPVWREIADAAALGNYGIGITGGVTANLIAAGTDLNNMRVSGIYGQNANVNATLALNYPAAQAGTLLVENSSGSITNQTYTQFNSSKKFVRSCYNSVWTAWDEQVTVTQSGVNNVAIPTGALTGGQTWTGNRFARWDVTSEDGPGYYMVGMDMGYASNRRMQIGIQTGNQMFFRYTDTPAANTSWKRVISDDDFSTAAKRASLGLSDMAVAIPARLPFSSLMPDSGRFAGKINPLQYTATTFTATPFLNAYNGGTWTEAGKYIYNNNNGGGTAGTMTEPTTSWLIASGRGTGVNIRYGVEFFIGLYTCGTGTATPSTMNGTTRYLTTINGTRAFFQSDMASTFAAWIRVKTGSIHSTMGMYINGVYKDPGEVLTSSNGWAHIRIVAQSSTGYNNAFPNLYATASAAFEMALPAFYGGGIDTGLHAVPLSTMNELIA